MYTGLQLVLLKWCYLAFTSWITAYKQELRSLATPLDGYMLDNAKSSKAAPIL